MSALQPADSIEAPPLLPPQASDLTAADLDLMISTLEKARPAIIAHRPHPTKRGYMVGFGQFFGPDDQANYRLKIESTSALYDLDFKLWPRHREALLAAAKAHLQGVPAEEHRRHQDTKARLEGGS
jgi:hypothetical protein